MNSDVVLQKKKPFEILWTEKDKNLFKKALMRFGKDFNEIQKVFPERSISQVKNFFLNYYKKLDLLSILKQRERESVEEVSEVSEVSENCQPDNSMMDASSFDEEAVLFP